MGQTAGLWFALLTIAIPSSLLFVRSRFPNVSRRAETTLYVIAAALFFLICGCFLGSPAPSPHPVDEPAGVISRG